MSDIDRRPVGTSDGQWDVYFDGEGWVVVGDLDKGDDLILGGEVVLLAGAATGEGIDK